jgi:hypothetical protein
MKLSLIIPVYLSRKDKKWVEGDIVYDHPTPINQKGTLVRTLESLETIKKEHLDVILVVSTTTGAIDNEVESWVKSRLGEAKYIPKNLYVFTQKDLDKLSLILNMQQDNAEAFYSMNGYSQVRNACLLAGTINKSDAIIFLDDDELVQDQKFIQKIQQGLNTKIKNKKIRFITGMCPEGEVGSYIRIRKYSPWMTYWDKIKFQNETLSKVIEGKPRFKLSPLTHGGLCVIHKDIFLNIPFDPIIKRGEDMDYNISCRMFGYGCYMDNELEIRHCPPPRIHEAWQGFREDMIRFFIQRNKIAHQNIKLGTNTIVKVNDFNPYPGNFLGPNLEDMIFKSQMTLALEYLSRQDTVSAVKSLENIKIARDFSVSPDDYFSKYMDFVKTWRKLNRKLKQQKYTMRSIHV